MMDQPLVTIGILSYNRPDDLERAIRSVAGQSYANLEILISDNGSTAFDAKQVITKFVGEDKRIQVFFHEENKGPLFNFHFLQAKANGKYFAWLADDDRFSADYVKECVEYFGAKQGVVLTTNMPVFLGTGESVDIKYIPFTEEQKIRDKYKQVIRHIFNDLNLFYYGLINTEVLSRCKYYLKGVFGGDTFLLLELLNYGDLYINPAKKGFEYQVHPNQTSSSALHYKKITVSAASSYVERKWFFTSSVFFAMKIIFSSQRLTLLEKWDVAATYVTYFIKSKRFHLIKYDLGLNGIIKKLRSLSGK